MRIQIYVVGILMPAFLVACSGKIFAPRAFKLTTTGSDTPAACTTEAFPISRMDHTFTRPWSTFVDSDGNQYISHSSFHVTLKVSPSGRIIQQFGVLLSGGSGNSQLNTPFGIDVDSQGRVWICEQTNRRVHVFNADGSHAFFVGSAGTGLGQFGGNSPGTVRLNEAANLVMVSDYGNSRVNTFDLTGAPIGQFASGHSLSNSTAYNSDFTEIAVSEQGSYNVKVFDPAGTLLRTIGSGVSGSTNADFNVPTFLHAYSGGWVIPDIFNNRVQIFDSSGAFVRSIPVGDWVWGVFYDEIRDRLYASTNSNGLKVYKLDGTYIGQTRAFGSGADEWNGPALSDVHKTTGKMLVADKNNNRVKLMDHCATSSSIIGAAGAGAGQMSTPEGAFFVGDDRIAVVDSGNDRVQVFLLDGTYVSSFGSSGSADGQFSYPRSGLYNKRGQFVILDSGAHNVQVFSSDGTFVAKYFSSGSGNSNLSTPVDIVQTPAGHYLIADQANNRVQEFDEDFVYVKTFGSGVGLANGQLTAPASVAYHDGEVFISDGASLTFRVSVFSEAGVFDRKIGGARSFAPGGFLAAPTRLRFDYFGKLLASEPASLHRIQKLDPADGRPIINTD